MEFSLVFLTTEPTESTPAKNAGESREHRESHFSTERCLCFLARWGWVILGFSTVNFTTQDSEEGERALLNTKDTKNSKEE